MTKILCTVSLAALVMTLGCDELGDAPGNGDRAEAGGDGDSNLDPGGGSSCAQDSPDAEGCACTAGEPARSCSLEGATESAKGSCRQGVQDCVTAGSTEFQSSAWGPCVLSGDPDGPGEPNEVECQTSDEDQPPSDEDQPPGEETDCCTAEVAECVAGGEPAAVCDAVDQICHGATCANVTALCDATTVPLSPMCARLYYQCFTFSVNKCFRMSYDICMSKLADAALCSAWDASCGTREAHCANLLGNPAPETPNYAYMYPCTDWGHLFDPCWADYLACTLDAVTCKSALDACMGSLDDVYISFCANENPSDDDEKKDPS